MPQFWGRVESKYDFLKVGFRRVVLLQFCVKTLKLTPQTSGMFLQHERDLAGPGVYLPASDPEELSVTICSPDSR